MRRIFPFISAFDQYSTSDFKHDAVAGLTVGVMLIPQGMAYALIAGLPPVYGLYAGLFPPLMYALFGTSRQLAVGPAAMDSLLVAMGVSTLAVAGTESYLAIAIFLALLVGMIQLTMGVFRLGFLINFVSIPVMNGFIYAVALTIAFSQLYALLGLETFRSTSFFILATVLFERMGSFNPQTLLLGIGAVTLLLLNKKLGSKIPGGLLTLALGIGLVSFFKLDVSGVKVLGAVPSGLPTVAIPTFDWALIRALFPVAVTLAMVGFIEATSVAKTLQRKHRSEYEILSNRELIGLGFGNIVGSLFGSFPTTGGLSRSAVNENAGAKSIIATLVSVGLVILTLVWLTPYFYYLPKAALSAIILVAVLGLINLRKVKELWKTDRHDFYMLLATFLCTLIFGVDKGVLLGVVLSVLVLVYKTSKPHMVLVGRVEGTDHYRSLARYKTAIDDPKVAILRLDARLYFGNAGALKAKVAEVISCKPGLQLFILDAQSISDVDSTGLEALSDIYDDLLARSIVFKMVSMIGPVRDKLKHSGFVDTVGLTSFCPSISSALKGDNDPQFFQTND